MNMNEIQRYPQDNIAKDLKKCT